MRNPTISFYCIILISIACLNACQQPEIHTPTPVKSEAIHDQVYHTALHDIHLGDGVSIDLQLSVRWRIMNPELFYQQFNSSDTFSLMIMRPRMLEQVRHVANQYTNIDSVFGSQRQAFIQSIKKELYAGLAEDGLEIKEIMLPKINFPKSYLKSLEEIGLQNQELANIQRQKRIELEQAQARKAKAEAEGKVAIAKAEAEGRLQKIKAKTEQSRRASELEKAQTLAEVDQMKAKAEAERKRLLAKADLEKKRELKNLEIQKKRELDQLEIEKQRMAAKAEFDQQIEFAKLCTENPVYASFLVNKELASKVEIAVLPTGSDPTIFGDVLKQRIKN